MLTTVKLLEIEERYRNKVYYCSEGYPTWLIGKKVGKKGQPLSDFAMLDAPISVAYAWLDYDLQTIIKQCQSFAWFSRLNQARKDIVISMCYQLGFDGFCKFKQTIKHIENGSFALAAQEMLDSKWAKQTPERAHRHSKVMSVGDWDAVEQYKHIGD
jgi:lysozyme